MVTQGGPGVDSARLGVITLAPTEVEIDMRAFLLSMVMILFVAPPAMAEGMVLEGAAVKDMTGAELLFSDAVDDGCLPRPDSAKNAAEVELRRSNFGIKPGSNLDITTMQISFVGYGWPEKTGCVASFSLEVWELIRVHDSVTWVTGPHLASLLLYRESGTLSGPKQGFQKQVEEKSQELARNFVLLWLRLRQDAE